jgi:hypothetical protein
MDDIPWEEPTETRFERAVFGPLFKELGAIVLAISIILSTLSKQSSLAHIEISEAKSLKLAASTKLPGHSL